MTTYWHVTPESNLDNILKEGLRPKYFRGVKTPYFTEEDKPHVLFLGKDVEEATGNLDVLWNEGVNPNERYTLLKIELPYRLPLQEDEFGLSFTTRAIPPKAIQVVETRTLDHWMNG